MGEDRRKIDVLKVYTFESVVETIMKLESLGYVCDLKTNRKNGWLKSKTYTITTYRVD